MPAETAAKPDTAILLEAVAFSLRYLLDPQRGAGKNLPTDAELGNQFPNSQITTDTVKNWLYNELGSTNLEEIIKDQTKIQQELEKLERFEQVSSEGTVPKISSETIKLAQTSKARVSALGVLAELEAIEPLLKKHQQEITPKLTDSLKPQVKSLIEKLGVKDLPAEQIATLTEDIASEVTRETLENLPKITGPAQMPDVITDSLIQTLLVDPAIAPKLAKFDQQKLAQKVAPIASQVTTTHQNELETAAVLGSLSQIIELKKPDPQVAAIIESTVEGIIESQHPLALPEQVATLKGNLSNYLTTYIDNLEKEILPQLQKGQIPTFQKLQEAQQAAHQKALPVFEAGIIKDLGPQAATNLKNQVTLGNIPVKLADYLKLRPITREYIETLGLGRAQPNLTTFTKAVPTTSKGIGLMLTSKGRFQEEAYHTLLSYDKERLGKTVSNLESQVKKFNTQLTQRGSLNYSARKEYAQAQRKLQVLKKAQEFTLKKPKRFQTYLSYFQSLPPGQRLNWAAQSAWETTQAHFGEQRLFVPRYALAKTNQLPQFLASRTFGSLAFMRGAGNFHFGFTKPTLGMGIPLIKGVSTAALGIGIASNALKRIIKGSAALFGGLGLYFLALGKAAFTGFLIGAGIGGTIGAGVGAFLGFQIGLAFGPLAPITVPVFTFLGGAAGGFLGGAIGGAVGGLIALGIASGSATMVTMGVGAGVGGVVGGYVGAGIGGSIGAGIGAGLTVITGGLAAPLIPVFTTLGVAVGTAAGAFLGALTGAALGYLIGNYLIPFAKGAFDAISSAFTGTGTAAGSAAAGFFGAVGGFFTGAASAIWGGITTAGGAALGFLSGAANFIVGGLSTLSIPASAAMIPVAGGIGAVAIGGTIVGLVTATSFFNSETDIPSQIKTPGENQFFTLSKTSNPQKLGNNDLPHDITFNITLTAKETKLTNIQVTDQLKVQTKSNDFLVTLDKNGKPISPPCADKIPTELEPNQSWDCQFVIVADKNPPERNFSDSFVANTVTVTTTPEGKTAITDSAVATVVIGNPPTICAIFEIQGPWSNDEKKSIDEVCKTLDRSPKIVSLLQKAGTIFLIRVADGSLGSGVCGTVNGANTISISCNMANVVFAKYVIIHELGHVLGNYNGAAYNAFIGVYNQEGLMPTYPFADGGSSESFAEMIADFVISKSYNYPPRSWSNYPGGPWDFSPPQNGYTSFKNDRPAHYNFAKTEIFGGVEY